MLKVLSVLTILTAHIHNYVICRNIPKIIEVISMDGSSGQQMEASKADISSGLYIILFLHLLTNIILYPYTNESFNLQKNLGYPQLRDMQLFLASM